MSKRKKNKNRNARYEILKRKYSKYFIIMKDNKIKYGLKSYKSDYIILMYIRTFTHNLRNDLYKYLEDNRINYIILSPNNELEIFEYDNNYNYNRLLNKSYLYAVLNTIKNK